EGVPGAGKDTLAASLCAQLDGELCFSFAEAAVLCDWQHFWLQDIDLIRMQLAESLVHYVEQVLDDAPDAYFIFNRFHLSINVMSMPFRPRDRYERLLDRMASLSVKLLLPVLPREEIERRAAHVERRS